MKLSLPDLQKTIETCEFDRWLGLTVTCLDDDRLVLEVPLRREMLGTPKIDRLHGGVVGSIIDATGCYLLIAKLNKRVSTVHLAVDYLRPAHGSLVATGRIVKLGQRICVTEVDVVDTSGKLVASGRLTVVPSDIAVGEESAATARL